jgi:Glyceraldehyde 3-phosphate dehydrogenase, NAD binding domain
LPESKIRYRLYFDLVDRGLPPQIRHRVRALPPCGHRRRADVDGRRIAAFAERDPANLLWADLGVDLVLECTGLFKA